MPVRTAIRCLRSTKGFTLLELLIVLAILAMIASVAAPRATKYFRGAQGKTAALQVQNLATAVDLFFLDTGQYPPAEQGLSSLMKQPPGVANWDGPYLKTGASLQDPWNTPYQYELPGRTNPFEVFTYGSDGAPGGSGDAADIGTWQNQSAS